MPKFTSLLNKNDVELLSTLGLSEEETAIYLSLLELGEGTIQEIARKSGIKRTSVYNFISPLTERRFISEIKKGKRRIYSAANPHFLVELEKSRLAAVEQLIPELMAINNKARTKPRVTYHEGTAGIREIYAILLQEGQTMYAWEDLDLMFRIMPIPFTKAYPAERAARRIPARTITRDTPLAREFVKDNIRFARETRFIDTDELGTDIEICGNKVALVSLRKDAPFGVLIEDESIAATFRLIWRERWDQLPPYRPTEEN